MEKIAQRSAAAAKQSADAIAKAAKAAAWRTKATRNSRIFFPNEIIYHMPWAGESENNDKGKVAKFRVSPKMTKIEMKNWIEQLYDTPVKKVNTVNREGSIQRQSQGKGYYKRPDFKIAYVFLEEPWVGAKK